MVDMTTHLTPGQELEISLPRMERVVVRTAGLAEVTTEVEPRRGLGRLRRPTLKVGTINALIHFSIVTEEAVVTITVTSAAATDQGVSFGQGCNFSGAQISGISGGDHVVGGEKQPKKALLVIKGRGEFQIAVQD